MRHASLAEQAAVRTGEVAESSSECAAACWAWRFVALGVAARLVRYLCKFPLWEDESFLAANLLDRGYLALTQPLDYAQVAPVPFLWIQRTAVDLFGFHEYGLRAFSLACGLAGLFLFRHVAARIFTGWPLAIAVGVFAISYPLVRYSAEAKPYGSDMLVGLIFLALTVEWLRAPQQTRWLWILTALAPLGMALSFPAVFAAGGASLALGCGLLTDRTARGWAAWVSFNLVVAGSFLAILRFAVGKQSPESIAFMQTFWDGSFPPSELAKLPGWLLSMHTGDMVSYPVGSRGGGGTLAFLGILAGIVALFRAALVGSAPWSHAKRYSLLLAVCVPLALNLVAAALGKYPYGNQVRLTMYHAGQFCLLIGLGWGMTLGLRAPAKLMWIRWRPGGIPLRMAFATFMLTAVSSGLILRDFVKPTKNLGDTRARDFAQWFWFEMPHRGEVVCAHSDLGEDFTPELRKELSWFASYHCNQRIYSPRHARREAADLSRVTADRPLYCVAYTASDPKPDPARIRAWIASMSERFDLDAHERFPATRYVRHEKDLYCTDYVELYRFVPKRTPASPGSTPTEPAGLTRQPDAGLRK